MLGVMKTDEAKRLAREANLDLVEVNPKAQPPVCKIMDYGKFKYDEKKRANEAKKRQNKIEIKEVKMRPKTDDHDIDFKVKHVRRFLEDNNKVKITVRFRGREITHPETALKQINAVLAKVGDLGSLEQTARMEGRTMTAIVAPKNRGGGGGGRAKPTNSQGAAPKAPNGGDRGGPPRNKRDAKPGPTVEHRKSRSSSSSSSSGSGKDQS